MSSDLIKQDDKPLKDAFTDEDRECLNVIAKNMAQEMKNGFRMETHTSFGTNYSDTLTNLMIRDKLGLL